MNRYSSVLTQYKSRGASQAMLYATGLTEEDMDKPQVGIASCWYEGNPCNMHLLELAGDIKKGVKEEVRGGGEMDDTNQGTRSVEY